MLVCYSPDSTEATALSRADDCGVGVTIKDHATVAGHVPVGAALL